MFGIFIPSYKDLGVKGNKRSVEGIQWISLFDGLNTWNIDRCLLVLGVFFSVTFDKLLKKNCT